jgi:hypothetical protein
MMAYTGTSMDRCLQDKGAVVFAGHRQSAGDEGGKVSVTGLGKKFIVGIQKTQLGKPT